MTHDHKHKASPTDGPLPPNPPFNPPTKKLTGFWASIAVLFFSTVAVALKTAYQVSAHFMTWDTFTNLSAWPKLANFTFNGFVYALIPGFALGLLTIVVALAGPQVWTYLGPILVAAASKTMHFVRGMSLAFRGLPAPPVTPDDGKETND